MHTKKLFEMHLKTFRILSDLATDIICASCNARSKRGDLRSIIKNGDKYFFDITSET